MVAISGLTMTACGKPPVQGLRESFAQQIEANRFVREFQRDGEELRFSGQGAEGGAGKWRVHIDSAVIDANDDPAQPYKGTVKSSWYLNDQIVLPSGRESNLPIELLANGVSQDCWAFWDEAAKKWDWE